MTIKERAKEYSKGRWDEPTAYEAYIAGAKEQQAIDIGNACIILCRYACPHKIDSNKCFNTMCETWEIFRRMMEE